MTATTRTPVSRFAGIAAKWSAQITLSVLLLAAVLIAPAQAKEAEIYTGFFSNTAVQGYDPVAYFTEGKPVKGSNDHTLEWKGATWKFSSAENKAKFEADPEAFAPQYGGYCAWAVAQGYTAKGDAQHWAIRGGKLYLNYNADVQNTWLSDPDGFIEKADANWPSVLDK